MTEAIWLSIGSAALVTIVMSASGLFLATRSAKRVDRLQAESDAILERRRTATAVKDFTAPLIDTRP